MSVNIRDYVSNDHIESIGEIAKSQSAIIQALSIDNSKLQQELQEIKKEHSIMKQFIYENGLWGKFLNDDRFIEHLRSDE